MRVAVMIDRLVVGGVEKTAIEEVRALRDLGVDATLLVLKRDPSVPEAFRARLKHLPVEYLDDRIPGFLRVSWRIPGFTFFSVFHLVYAAALPFRVRRREWDGILAHNSYTTFTAWTVGKARGIPYAMFVWDPITSVLAHAYPSGLVRVLRPLLMPFGRLADRILARGARAVLTASRTYVAYLERLLPAGAAVKIVPPGCVPVAMPREAPGDHLLAATSWKAGKHLEDLLRAMQDLGQAKVVIAGRWLNPDYRAQIDELIAHLGLAPRVRFVGEYDDAGMARLASEALASVTASAELGFGMPALEAAAQGCAFVCPRVAGIAPYFEDGVEAFYFDLGDVAGLARILRSLVIDPALAQRAGLAAWEKARSLLTWTHHARLVAGLLAEKPDPAAPGAGAQSTV